MNKEIDDQLQQKIMSVVPELAKLIEAKANEYYTEDHDKLNFIISCTVNLCGNVSIQYSGPELFQKERLAGEVIGNLITWFKIALNHEKHIKEAH